MKGFKLILVSLFFILALGSIKTASAQCAMCTTNVESNNRSGASTTKGLNNGIIYLLSAPYLAVGIVGLVWYKKYRRKNITLKMRDEKLHLN